MPLPESDHQRISAAISAAEENTAGEIFCVFTEAADDLKIVPLAYAALAALVVPPLLLWSGLVDPGWFLGWSAAADLPLHGIVSTYAGLSALCFAAVWLCVRPAAIRYRVAPKSLRQETVDRAAMESFLSHGIHTTDERTGVLIFLSRRDHIAEIIADEGIYRRVDQNVWAEVVDGMLARAREGDIAGAFQFGIEHSGRILAEHFPPRSENVNELPDRLVEL